MKYTALDTGMVRRLQAGGADANGQTPERSISDGNGNPCRHCLQQIPEGEPMLILAHRPFPTLHPYSETGPIFLCAAHCQRSNSGEVPEILKDSPDYLLKGYGTDDRIVYGTGAIIPHCDLRNRASDLLARPDVQYLHVRSARNNCYMLRIDP